MTIEDLVFGALLLIYGIALWKGWQDSQHVSLADRIKTLLLFLVVLILPVLGWLSGWKP